MWVGWVLSVLFGNPHVTSNSSSENKTILHCYFQFLFRKQSEKVLAWLYWNETCKTHVDGQCKISTRIFLVKIEPILTDGNSQFPSAPKMSAEIEVTHYTGHCLTTCMTWESTFTLKSAKSDNYKQHNISQLACPNNMEWSIMVAVYNSWVKNQKQTVHTFKITWMTSLWMPITH